MELVRAALAESSFGVLTTIDLRATLEEKLGEQVPPEMILGACNPRFAYAATQALPSVAALLPCNVVVRWLDQDSTLVEVFDPAAMARLAGEAASALAPIVKDVRERLIDVLHRVDERGETKED